MFWMPILLSTAMASMAVMRASDEVMKDAGEYDGIARSIINGGYELYGQPTMLREPGYPVFRAMLYLGGGSVRHILWTQVIFMLGSILLFSSVMRRLFPTLVNATNWALALVGYSYSYYASRHLAETLVGFLVALLLWLTVRAEITRSWYSRGGVVLVGAMLSLTRFSFVFIPIACLAILTYWDWQKDPRRQRLFRLGIQAVMSVLLLAVCIAPWSIRNGRIFGRWSIADRGGIQVYARAYKAESSWGVLMDTYVSVLVGRAWQQQLMPKAAPIITEQWKAVWSLYQGSLAERFPILSDRDAFLQASGIATIRSRPAVFLRYIAWTGVEGLRFLALASPRSQDFSIESMFGTDQQDTRPLRLFIVACLHVFQLAWWTCIILGMWKGFSHLGTRFLPGVIVLAGMAPHVALDVIIRYAAPLLPCICALAVVGVTSVKNNLKDRNALLFNWIPKKDFYDWVHGLGLDMKNLVKRVVSGFLLRQRP